MFIKVIKIIFWLITLTLLAFLVDVTFYFSNISNNSEIIKKVVINKDDNIYKLYYKNNNLEKLKIKDNNDFLTWIYQKNINFFDKIYFTNLNSFNVSNSGWINNIYLKKWVFLLNLNDLIWKYDIKWEWFEIQPKTAWIIFIDNTDKSKVFVLSDTSVLKMSFLSMDGKVINYYYMYPHNYLMFNIKNNTFSRLWTDVFRIKTIVKEGFLTDNITNNLREWWKLYWVFKWYKDDFLKTSVNQIKINYKKNNDIFNKLRDLKNFNLIWEDYINKYFSFFVNDTKKRIYFKQLVLNKLQKLLNTKEKGTILVTDIISNLNSIKNVNKKDYNDLCDIIRWYYNIIIQNNNIDNKIALNNFLPLAQYLKNDKRYKKRTDLDLYVLLKNIFFWYDFKNQTHIEKNFNDFVNSYFIKFKIDNWKLLLWKWINLVLLESFSYYLEDYLNNFAFNSKHIDLDINIFRLNINILEKYFYLNKKIYFSNKKLELINTWLFKNYNLLNSILSFIRNNFFEKQRDLNNLLVPYTKYKLDLNDVNKLSNILKNFFELKDNYIDLLKDNSKQRFLYKNFRNLYNKYEEYFLALTSYENYKVKYNIKNKELVDYYIKKNQKVFWINDVKKYLSQFEQANFTDTKITQTGSNNNLFYVDNFNVSNQVFSFYIEPDRDYTISNIIIKSAWLDKDKFKYSTYSLEKDRKLWEKQQRYVKADKKAFYDFKYYFKYKFNNYSNNNLANNTSSVNNINKQKESDNESVMIFKRDTLLAKTGEFSSIYDMIKLKYNDVIVKSLDDITLNNFIVYKRIKDHDYNLIFTSKYFIDKTKNKHYFYNPGWIYISFYNVIDWNRRRNLFWWSKLKIGFNINLIDFRKIFTNILNQIVNIKQLYYSINSNLWIYDVNMEYLKDWNIIIWFDFNWKNIRIYLSWDKVLFIKENWKILQYKNISLGQDVNKVLLKLK